MSLFFNWIFVLSHKFSSLIYLFIFLFITESLYVTSKYGISASAASIEESHGNDWKDLLLTESEKFALEEFKARVSGKITNDRLKTDFYLTRWLRVNNFNIHDAEEMLYENLEWRKENNIDELLSEDFSDIAEELPATNDTHDMHDRPVATINLGMWDLRGAVFQGKIHRVDRFVSQVQEFLVQRIFEAQDAGKEVTRAVVLVDLEGFNAQQHLCPSCLSVFMQLTSGMEAHWPMFWEEIICINTPPFFQVVMDTVGGILSEETRRVVRVFTGDKNTWEHYLDHKIDRSERYENFGGTRKLD